MDLKPEPTRHSFDHHLRDPTCKERNPQALASTPIASPQGVSKLKVLDAVRRATRGVPLTVALRVLGLSATRYHAWRQREPDCLLEDRSSCPRTKPTQLAPPEIGTMHQMVTDDAYRHISVRGIALLAQRLSKVFAAPATWYALIRECAWLRPAAASTRRSQPWDCARQDPTSTGTSMSPSSGSSMALASA